METYQYGPLGLSVSFSLSLSLDDIRTRSFIFYDQYFAGVTLTDTNNLFQLL